MERVLKESLLSVQTKAKVTPRLKQYAIRSQTIHHLDVHKAARALLPVCITLLVFVTAVFTKPVKTQLAAIWLIRTAVKMMMNVQKHFHTVL